MMASLENSHVGMSSSKEELAVDGNSQVDLGIGRGKSRENGGASHRVKNLADPAELLRSLDLLRDKLIQPFDIRDIDGNIQRAPHKSKTKAPELPRASHAAHCFPKGPENFHCQPACMCRQCCNSNLRMPLHAPCLFQGSNPREPKNTAITKPRYQQRPITHKRCEPLAGGSPFLFCPNCVELLQVPPIVLSNEKVRKKLKCGSCFKIITFQTTRKNFVLPTPPLKSEATSYYSDTSNVISRSPRHHFLDNSHSRYYGGSGYNALSANEKRPVLASHSNSIPLRSEATSYSSNTSNVISRSPRNQVLGDSHFRYDGGSGYNAPSANGKLPVLASHSNSPPDGLMEKDQKYLDTSKLENMGTEGDQTYSCDAHGDDEIPHAIIHKREVLESPEPLGKEMFKVSVNGHSIPYDSVKEAEKQAGSIQPGEYWYDYRAGFWGVMGEPCMGIIPPFIKEFKYAMPKNCAAGNTAVVVNGRELNHEDLQLLVDRGLPKSSGRSYMIDTSGRVVDAISGKELNGLGRLAPTVEKLKKGFGMRRPLIAAD